MIFVYKTPFGPLTIRPQSNGRWALWIRDEVLGSYHSPMAAADDVYCQVTGDYDFDDWDHDDIPTGLDEWERYSR